MSEVNPIWSEINVGYDAAEETINFGTRAIAQSDTDIYETNTIATVKSTNEELLKEKPNCIAIFSTLGVGVSVDNSWMLFNLNFSELIHRMSFECNIETFEISEDGCFIFIALENGFFSCFCSNLDWTLLFSKEIERPSFFTGKPYFSKIIAKNSDDGLDVYIILNTGKIIKVEGVDFNLLRTFTKEAKDDEVLLNNLPLNPKFNFLQTIETSCDTLSACALKNEAIFHKYLLWLCGQYLQTWTGDNETNTWETLFSFSESLYVTKIGAPCNGDKVIGLTNKGSIVFFCPFTYLKLGLWSKQKVLDFTFVTNTINGNICTQLLLLIDSGVTELCLCDIRGFSLKMVYTLPLESAVSFLVAEQFNCEDILFIEGYMDDSKVNALRIKTISISHPEFRLERLLQRGKFIEAENFASIFSLDIELVHKAKIKWLMSRLQLWDKIPEETLNSNFNELVSLLAKIKDLEFVADCCLKTVAPNLTKIQQLLEYAIDKISSASSRSDNLERLLDSLGVSLRTLGTFMLICPGELGTPDKWFIFSSANPISLCKQHLSKGEVKEAILICSRHNRKIKNELAVNMAISLFEILPLTVSVEETFRWYECYVPLLLRAHPQLLPQLTLRIIEKARLLEFSDNECWPDISLKFLTDMINLLERLLSLDDSSAEGGVILYQGTCLPTSPINQLHCMVTILEKLYALKHKHSILISYDTFSNQHASKDIEEFLHLTSLLFDYVPIEGIPSLIRDFVEPYCIANHKDIDYIIYYYVSDIVKKYSCCWDIESSFWESKCIAFANCIRSVSEKIKVIEVIVRNAKVPWSAEVNEIAQKSIRIKHPLAQSILHYSKNVSKKVILNKYDLPLEWVDAPNMFLFQCMLKKGFDGVLKDALELLGTIDKLKVYECYIHHCIKENKLDEVMSLLRTLDSNQIVVLCDCAIYSASLQLQNKYCDRLDPYLEVLPAIESLLSTCNKETGLDKVKFILASHKIKIEYGIIVDSSDLYSLEVRESILKACLLKAAQGFCEMSEHNMMKIVNKQIQKVWTLTKLLELQTDLGLLELASIYSKMNNVELSCKFLKIINDNCIKNIGKENIFFKTHLSKRLRSLITELLTIIATSPEISVDDTNIMCQSAEILVAEGDSRDFAINMDVLKACKIVYVPPQKPFWSSLFDSTESFRPVLSPVICESLTQCINNLPGEENNQLLREEVERTVEDMPRDLISLNRMTLLKTILANHQMIDMRTIKKVKNISIQTVSTILLNVIKSRQFDVALAQSLLQFFQPDQAIKWLQNVSGISLELRHNRSLALVGKQYCKLLETLSTNSDNSNLHFFINLYLNSKWGLKLQQFGISAREAFKGDLESRKNVLLRLMNVPRADLPLLREYCEDVKLDIQECLLLYLKLKLLSWKPRFTVITNNFNGKSEPVYEKDDEVFVTCYGIATQITDQKKLIVFLTNEVWDNVNPYYYEVFLVILDILSNLSEFENSELMVENYYKLHFLKSYTRISPCQEAESDFWFAKFPSSTSLPTIAQYRLPFDTLPYDIPKSLKPELSLETYELWIQAPFWPQSNPDTNAICLYTIYNLKDEEVSTVSGWYLHERKRDLLNKITKCIERISEYESSVAAWYFVVNHVMPPGIDQVHAAQKCLLKAKEWIDRDKREVAKSGYSKVEKKYYTVSTVHILYTYRLARPEYLSLVSQPAELISQLYQDPCITDNYNVGSTNNNPNINEAVESIASLHNVNLTSVIQELLTEWLQPDNSFQASFMESTMLSHGTNANELAKTDNIFRACYVLLGCKELRNAEDFLIGLAFPRNHDDTSKPIGVRLRALQVLTAITSTEDLEEITSRDKDSIRDYMTVLSLVYELDRHGMAYTISSFELASKETIIKNLLNRSDAAGIKLAVRIALSYKINNSNIWNLLIEQMTHYVMVPELETVLIEVDYLRINRDILSNAWNCIILSTLARGKRINPEERKNLTEKSYKLTISCPVFSLLDLNTIVAYFKTLERNDFATVIENISKDSNKNN